MRNGKVYETKRVEGTERAAVLVIVPLEAGNMLYLCHAWGMSEGIQFLDTVEGNRIEIHGDQPFLIQVPGPGMTYQLDGQCRDLQVETPAVTLQ